MNEQLDVHKKRPLLAHSRLRRVSGGPLSAKNGGSDLSLMVITDCLNDFYRWVVIQFVAAIVQSLP